MKLAIKLIEKGDDPDNAPPNTQVKPFISLQTSPNHSIHQPNIFTSKRLRVFQKRVDPIKYRGMLTKSATVDQLMRIKRMV
jgi:hypothetical protein